MVLINVCVQQTAQVRFIRDKTIYTQQLDALRKHIGDKHISRAHPFYELMTQSVKVRCFDILHTYTNCTHLLLTAFTLQWLVG